MTPELADGFAGIGLGHVTREYPTKLDHVLAGPGDASRPRELHPIFYGSFDWHSCVHSYWMLAHLYRRFPAIPHAGAIRVLFDTHLVPDLVAGECRYLSGAATQGFERPYGWAWLLKLAAELALLGDLEIIERLSSVRGIGRWTVEMMLMFQLERRDVLPVDDFGVRNGFRLAYGLKGMPTPRALAPRAFMPNSVAELSVP